LAGYLSRERSVARLAIEQFDLAVIGAGINGAACARDAAMRGLRVALVDRGDFAGATSSSSSKLIHGGFRYLPQGQLRLVYHALRERERLRNLTAPHLVRPIQFLFPTYRNRGFGRLTMVAGMFLYDLFARTAVLERHRSLNRAQALECEPALNREGLTGAALYYDAYADDARVTIENVLDAAIHTAAVANYCAVESFDRADGRIVAARIRDLESGREHILRAKTFLNAAGPWVDSVRRLDDPDARPIVRLTKGVHLMFERSKLPIARPIVLTDHANRIVFAIPYDRYVMLGTTDTDFQGDPAEVRVDRADVDYLLAVAAESLPSIKLEFRDVASSFVGLRALIADDGKSPSSVPREQVVVRAPSGLITVAGGKLTTHREIAEEVVDRIAAGLEMKIARCTTMTTPLPGAREQFVETGNVEISKEVLEALRSRYGSRAGEVVDMIAFDPALATPLAADCPVAAAEAAFAVRREMARTLADFMVRRTATSWRYPRQAQAAAVSAAKIMGRELGWDAGRRDAEVEAFRAAREAGRTF
jgi:glycerol-3-phosphate dehydrogenase